MGLVHWLHNPRQGLAKGQLDARPWAGLSHGTAAYQADPQKKQKEAPLRMSDLYLDTSRSPEQRAQALLEELSLPEKMAQVRGIFPFGAYGENWEAISRMTKNGIGQVSTLQMREFHTKEACCAWQRRCSSSKRRALCWTSACRTTRS